MLWNLSRSPATRRTAIVLSAFPGWGHVYLGRELQGLGVFTLATIAGFTFFNATFLYLGDFRGVVASVSAVAALLLVVYSVVDVVRLTGSTRLQRLARARDRLIWEGLLCYLRSDYLAAEQKFVECARLDSLDVEPVFRAGVAASRRGAYNEARRLLSRARKLDTELKWEWELEEELQRIVRILEKGRVATPRLGVERAVVATPNDHKVRV